MKETNNEPKWVLDNIEIELQKFGLDKGKYAGTICFKNKKKESFNFKLTPEMTNAYLGLIKESIIHSAETLGSKLAESLKNNE